MVNLQGIHETFISLSTLVNPLLLFGLDTPLWPATASLSGADERVVIRPVELRNTRVGVCEDLDLSLAAARACLEEVEATRGLVT